MTRKLTVRDAVDNHSMARGSAMLIQQLTTSN